MQKDPQQSSSSSSRDGDALESSSAAAAVAEQQLQLQEDRSEFSVQAVDTDEESEEEVEHHPPEEGTWEHWEEVYSPVKYPLAAWIELLFSHRIADCGTQDNTQPVWAQWS